MESNWTVLVWTIVGGLIVAFVGWFCKEIVARRRARKAAKTTEQPEKWEKLREGLAEYSTKLSELTSRLTPNQIDTSRPYVEQQLDEVRNDLPDHNELENVVKLLRHTGLQEKVDSGLESARVWRSRIDQAWRHVENLEVWEVDTRERREEALYWFSIARYEVHIKHTEFQTPILEAIKALEAVERGEDLAMPPGDNVFRRTARRLGAYLTKFGTIN